MLPSRDAPLAADRPLLLSLATRAGRGPVLVQGHAVLDRRDAVDGTLSRRTLVLVILGNVDEVCLVEATLGLALEISGLGTIGVMLASVHALISSPLKYPRSATTCSRSLPIAVLAAVPILASCARSLPMLVTSCVTIR